MKCNIRIIATMALGALALVAVPQKWTQVYTPKWTSFESRVRSCTSPTPMKRVAMDDWLCPGDGPIPRITWWGTLADPNQAKKMFYFAIYEHSATVSCRPGKLVWKACAIPSASAFVAPDCKGMRVFKFEAKFATPFKQKKATRYWLQISEADAESARPGQEDFRWSAHRDVMRCQALQLDAMGAFTQPLIDACDQKKDDLAFVLWPN